MHDRRGDLRAAAIDRPALEPQSLLAALGALAAITGVVAAGTGALQDAITGRWLMRRLR